MNLLKRLFNKIGNLNETVKITILVISVISILLIMNSGPLTPRKQHELHWCLGEFDTPRCHVELEKRKEAAYLKETSAK